MNAIINKLDELYETGWTLSAIADELKVTVNTVEKWKADKHNHKPRYYDAVIQKLEKLKECKRVPKKRRYKKGRYASTPLDSP